MEKLFALESLIQIKGPFADIRMCLQLWLPSRSKQNFHPYLDVGFGAAAF